MPKAAARGKLPIDLARLTEALRAANFRPDTRQYLTASELLLECARRGLPADEDADLLRQVLAPIFCTSPEEQAQFASVLASHLRVDAPPVGDDRTAPAPPARRRWASVVLVVGLSLTVGIAVALLASNRDAGEQASKGEAPPKDAGAATEKKPLPLSSVPEVENIATFEAVSAPAATEERQIAWLHVGLGAGACALTMFLLWLVVPWASRRLVLRRLPVSRRPELATLPSDEDATALFDEAALRRVTAALRRPRAEAAQEIDVGASVQDAVRTGGFPRPVYAARRAMPEYLALVERRGAQDHQARLLDEMLARLERQGLEVARYFFTGDPRMCKEAGRRGRTIALGDVLALNQRADVLLFVEAGGCFNPASSRLEPWIEPLRVRPRRAVLTPAPPAHWTRQEWSLSDAEFVVAGADEQGLAVYAEADSDWDISQVFPAPYARPYPRLLAGSTALALSRDCPPPDVLAKLLRELKGYLGPRGFTWLAACAAYPEIAWPLTLHLARAVWQTTEGPPREEDQRIQLATLARLPWMRVGFMPEWLRTTLLAQLPHETDQAVRESLFGRLDELARRTIAASASSPRRDGLEIAAGIDPLDIIRTADPGSAMRDAVFLGYMAGARIPAPALEAPGALRRLFRRVANLPVDAETLQRAHRPWRTRVAARVRDLLVRRPTTAGLVLSGVFGALALAVLAPFNVEVLKSTKTPAVYVAFSPSGDQLAAVAGDKLRVSNVRGEPFANLSGSVGAVFTAVSMGLGERVVTSNGAGNVQFWRASMEKLEATQSGRKALFSPDGNRLLVIGGGQAQLFEATDFRLTSLALLEHSAGVIAARFDYGGRQVGILTDRSAGVWVLSTGALKVLAPLSAVIGTTGSPESVIDVNPTGTVFAYGTPDREVKLVDARSGALFAIIHEPFALVEHVRFNRAGDLLATGWSDGHLRIYEVPRGKLAVDIAIPIQHASVSAIELRPQGRMLLAAAGVTDSGLRHGGYGAWVWDLDTKALVATLASGDEPVTAAFSPDGNRVVAVSGRIASIFSIAEPSPQKRPAPDTRTRSEPIRGTASARPVRNRPAETSQAAQLPPSPTGEQTPELAPESGVPTNPRGKDGVVGIDVSRFHGDIDWIKVKSSGVVFALAKATEGRSNVDSAFLRNWKGMKAAGLHRGAYHFFRPNENVGSQVDIFVNTVGQLSNDDLPPTLDLEVDGGLPPPEVVKGALLWLTEVEKRLGRRPIVYAGGFVRRTLREQAAALRTYPLWTARYVAQPPVMPLVSWTKWTFWQFTDGNSGMVVKNIAGISGPVNVDLFNGSTNELLGFIHEPRTSQ